MMPGQHGATGKITEEQSAVAGANIRALRCPAASAFPDLVQHSHTAARE